MDANLPLIFGALVAGMVVIHYGVAAIKQAGPGIQSAGPSPSSSTSSSPTTGKGVTPTNASETAFIHALLATIGAPATTANVNSLTSWFQHEQQWDAGPPDGGAYTHNPLNMEDAKGESGWALPSAAVGVAETAARIISGYPCIAAALRSGKGLCGQCASEFSTWSGGGYSSPC